MLQTWTIGKPQHVVLLAARLGEWRRGGGAIVAAVYWRDSRELLRAGCFSTRAARHSAPQRFCIGDGNDQQHSGWSMALLFLLFMRGLLRTVHAGLLAVSAVPMHYGCAEFMHLFSLIASVCLAVFWQSDSTV